MVLLVVFLNDDPLPEPFESFFTHGCMSENLHVVHPRFIVCECAQWWSKTYL